MNSLEKYLTEEYPADQTDISEIETALKSAVATYEVSDNFSTKTAWPYQVPSDAPLGDGVSASTTAMILNALLRYSGHFDNVKFESRGGENKKNVFAVDAASENCSATNILVAAKLLLDAVYASGPLLTKSGTYGQDDVFTLAWLAEICVANWNEIDPNVDEAKQRWEKLRTDVLAKVNSKIGAWGEAQDFSKLLSPEVKQNSEGEPVAAAWKAQAHAFPVLRLVQASRRLAPTNDLGTFYKYFETSLHEQLSFSSIPDSRFDPAELMFCLEGMLLCRTRSVDRTIFDRVLEVLTTAQNKSAFWRPVKPFLATAQGLVLFPVSVEIANSLMRSCVMFDNDSLHETYGSRCVILLRRYWQWLRARSVKRSTEEGTEYIGWHSEHVNQSDVIHLWETSQVMEFLLSYRNMLHNHIARTTLVLSRFKQEKLQQSNWDESQKKFEPVSSLGADLLIYKRIDTDFVKPRHNGVPRNFSMLLFGPPGTGKTTVAESVAKALDRRLITITVSDFLSTGGAQVEARAKDIFAVLMAQPSCVVLFDEIDHFLLDRDSTRYSKQDTVFQFMTPGMLTKINDLRRATQALFIVATNYEDRIDAAIKRTGRIDKKYLVLPPDATKRLKIIKQLLGKIKSVQFTRKFDDLHANELAALSVSSLYLGFKDIEAAVQAFEPIATTSLNTPELASLLEARARTISLEAYQSRFSSDGNYLNARETPMGEFLCLLALKLETEKDLKETLLLPVVATAVKVLRGSAERPYSATAEDIKRYATDLDESIVQALAALLKNIK